MNDYRQLGLFAGNSMFFFLNLAWQILKMLKKEEKKN
jgi:hypothetical protein